MSGGQRSKIKANRFIALQRAIRVQTQRHAMGSEQGLVVDTIDLLDVKLLYLSTITLVHDPKLSQERTRVCRYRIPSRVVIV